MTEHLAATEDLDRASLRYRSHVRVTFPAALSLPGLEPGPGEERRHGHDYSVSFQFETTVLRYPGVVVDDEDRAEISRYIKSRLTFRDLDQILERPATCEVIAEYLAAWCRRVGMDNDRRRLVSVDVLTGSGGNAAVHLPDRSISRGAPSGHE